MGRPFGQYELLDKLAQGGMAEVFLARQRGPGGFQKQVALKLLLPELADEPQLVELFLYEARTSALLSHPNLCQVFDSGEAQGRHYLAMEYLAGQTLSSVLRRAKKRGLSLPPELCAFIIARAAEGLAYAHEMKGPDGRPLSIVHRDVSPQNVMLTYDGQVKVLDFGIARAADRTFRTRTGQVRGKVGYMAPEQLEGRELDARCDVFALGVILHEALAGQPLFRDESEKRAMERLLWDPLPELDAQVPALLREIVAQALERERDRRLPSARELARRLDAAFPLSPSAAAEALAAQMRALFAAEQQDAQKPRSEESDAWLLGPGGQTEPGAELERRGTEPIARPPTLVEAPRVASTAPSPRRFALAASAVALVIAGAAVAAVSLRSRAQPAPVREVAIAPSPPPSAAVAASEPAKVAPAVPTPEPVITPPARSTKPVAATHSKRSHPKQVVAVAPVARASPVASGRLTLDTTPWTVVSWGARELGTTPLVEVSLPAGRQRLHAVNAPAHVDRYIEVEIRPGETTTQKVSW